MKQSQAIKKDCSTKSMKMKGNGQEKKQVNGVKKLATNTVDEIIKLRKATVGIGDDKMVMFRTIRGQLYVNIRKYRWDEHNRSFATKMGILLTPDEWKRLKEDTSVFDNVTSLDRVVQRKRAVKTLK